MAKIKNFSTIEKRLQELQRKLTEIAEIPKILSSTLATVSQTFDKLTTTTTTTLPPVMPQPKHCCRHHIESGSEDYCLNFCGNNEQKRKLSYDEDVYDYELSDDDKDGDDDDNDIEDANKIEFDAKEAYLQLKLYAAARQRKSKEVTPESDYASESNYPQIESGNQDQFSTIRAKDNGDHDDDDDEDGIEETNFNAPASIISNDEDNDVVNDDDDDDDAEISCDMYEEFNLSALKIPFSQVTNENDIEEFDDEDEDENENEKKIYNDGDDEEDFLTTTFTWNLCNKPKLKISDTDNDNSINLHKPDNEHIAAADDDTFRVAQQTILNKSKDMLCKNLNIKADTPERELKLDKLERSWPWADREKIIYKQSTCHLVPHKPLGLIEKRIQLLAKRNLLEHINKIKNPQ